MVFYHTINHLESLVAPDGTSFFQRVTEVVFFHLVLIEVTRSLQCVND